MLLLICFTCDSNLSCVCISMFVFDDVMFFLIAIFLTFDLVYMLIVIPVRCYSNLTLVYLQHLLNFLVIIIVC